MFSVSVVIPTYNGRDLLLKNLPPLFESLARTDAVSEVIVVDDSSSDDTLLILESRFPSVIIVHNKRNLGFAETMNRGIFTARNDIILALNNDVTVESDIISKALPRFADRKIFAVTPNIFDPRDNKNQAIYRLKPGICWFTDGCLQKIPVTPEIPLFFSSGGSSFYDRQKLLELGGISTLYAPFYVEDVDLSYQAWKRGWKCLLEPGATVWHPVNSTIRKYHRKRKIKTIAARNKHYFMWLNVTDPLLVLRYIVFLPFSLVWDLISFRKYKLIGFFWALAKLPRILRERTLRRKVSVIMDRDIINLVRFD